MKGLSVRLLTPDLYATRSAELDEAREAAVATYRSANLAAEMGSGTDAEIRKAKADLDAVEARIDALQSARVESQRIQALQTREARQAAHTKLAEETERLLGEREAAIARIEAKALDLGQELAGYEALTSQLRSGVTKYRPHYQPEGVVAHLVTSKMKSAVVAPERHRPLLPFVVATIEGNQRVLEGCSLSDREQAESSKVRNAVGSIAQQREMA